MRVLRRLGHHVEEEPVGASSAGAWPSHMRMEGVKSTSGEEQVWNEGHMELSAEDVTDKESSAFCNTREQGRMEGRGGRRE